MILVPPKNGGKRHLILGFSELKFLNLREILSGLMANLWLDGQIRKEVEGLEIHGQSMEV